MACFVMLKAADFAQDLLERISPAWVLPVPPEHPRYGKRPAREIDVFLYLVDVSTAWLAAGGLRSAAAMGHAQALSAAPPTLRNVLRAQGPQLIVDAANAGVSAHLPPVRPVLSRGLLSFALAGRYISLGGELASARSRHWLYLAYRLGDGSLVARAALLAAADSGPLLSEALMMAIVSCVAYDAGPDARSGLAQHMTAHGGVQVAPGYAAGARGLSHYRAITASAGPAGPTLH